MGGADRIEADVRCGLERSPKSLPPRLFYDEEGSRLYERITELPEYYLTRAERSIFEARAQDIVDRVRQRTGGPLSVVELGAGSASKTERLLSAVLQRQPRCLYVPIDVSEGALAGAAQRLAERLPAVTLRPIVGTHEEALPLLGSLPGPALVLFIGSSVGNLDDADASSLLRGLRRSLGPTAALVLGTDLRKSPAILIPAYDDAQGVTARFNKNVLTRINRELRGRFDLDRFRHMALWNEAKSQIEMHLESLMTQDVAIDALEMSVHFEAGETIHTESSVKYDLPRVERLLFAGGFAPEAVYFDRERRFAVHVASAR